MCFNFDIYDNKGYQITNKLSRFYIPFIYIQVEKRDQ